MHKSLSSPPGQMVLCTPPPQLWGGGMVLCTQMCCWENCWLSVFETSKNDFKLLVSRKPKLKTLVSYLNNFFLVTENYMLKTINTT